MSGCEESSLLEDMCVFIIILCEPSDTGRLDSNPRRRVDLSRESVELKPLFEEMRRR